MKDNIVSTKIYIFLLSFFRRGKVSGRKKVREMDMIGNRLDKKYIIIDRVGLLDHNCLNIDNYNRL